MDKTETLKASEHGHEQVAKQALNALAGGAVERALKALDMAEKIAGRNDSQHVSLTPHGWEYVYSAFDAVRAAFSTLTHSPAVDLLLEARCPLCQTAAPEAFVSQCNWPECPYRSNTK